MFKLRITEYYSKKSVRFLNKHKDIQSQYLKTIKLLSLNPFHNSLRTHKLQGNLAKYYSVSINMKYRIVLTIEITDELITLIDIGSHDEVY